MTKYFVNTIVDPDYYTPRYSSYLPTYYNSYYSPYYSSLYRYPSSYISSISRPYRYDIDLDIPDYKYRYYTTYTPRTPVWSQADRYSFVHGLTFKETAADIRYSAGKVLEDIKSPRRSVSVPRCTRVSSPKIEDNWLDAVCHTQRAVSRGRLSQPPSYHNISKCIVY